MRAFFLFASIPCFLLPVVVFGQIPEGSDLFEANEWITTSETPNIQNDQLNDLAVRVQLNDSQSWGSDILEILTSPELDLLKEHLRRFGPLEHMNELQLFLPVQRIYEIMPYVLVKVQTRSASGRTGKVDLQTHRDSRDEPGTYTFRMRGRMELGPTDLAWCMEQDAGEAWRPIRKGFVDFVNFGIHYRGVSGTDLIAGAYRIRFGEGLFTPNLYLNQKSPDALRVKAEGASARLNTSFDENSLKGICVRKRTSRIDVLAALGSGKVDARPGSLANEFTGFNTSGIHISNSELEGMDLVRRTQLLFHANWRSGSTLIGLSSATEWLSRSLEPELRADNKLYPRGQFFQDQGLNFRTNLGNALIFGELKTDLNFRFSQLGGCILSLGRTMDITLLARSYSNSNTSWNSSAFGRYGINRNEKGVMLGYKWYIGKYSQLNAVLDQYIRPGFTYPDPRNFGGGADWTLSYSVRKRGRYEHQGRIRLEQGQPGGGLSSVRFWVHSTREIHPKFFWTLRYQGMGRQAESSHYIQSELRFKDPKWEIVFQNAWQDQKGEPRANYYYEKDLIHSFHVSVLSGTAWRNMIILDHRPRDGHRMRLKIWQSGTDGSTGEFGLKLQWIYNWK